MRNLAGTVLEYRGTLAHREEQSENTRGTAGMAVNSSGPQRRQEEPCRNGSRIPRNTRSQRRTIREHARNRWNGCEQFTTTAEATEPCRNGSRIPRSGGKRNLAGTVLEYRGTLAHREEQSENTRRTAGMAVNSSGPQRRQEEPCRNGSRRPRNTRSQRRTVREHSRNSWNGCEQFRTTAEARGTLQDRFSNTAEHSLTEKNSQRTRAERLEWL